MVCRLTWSSGLVSLHYVALTVQNVTLMSLGRNNVNEKNGFILATSSIATLQQPAYAYTFYSFLVLVAAIQLRHFQKYVKGNENIPYNAKLALRSLHTQRLPLYERQRLRKTNTASIVTQT